jgi:vitamin B12 transporter
VKAILSIVLLICFTSYLHAQDIDTLSAIEKVGDGAANSSNNLVGSLKQSFDEQTLSQHQHGTLADFLKQNSSVFVKSNGVNASATLNIRGSSAAQNSVLWNGININNAGLGAADLSNVPLGIFQQVALVSGANAAQLGSGVVGGALMLDNAISFKQQQLFSTSIATNSIQNYNVLAKYKFATQRWYSSVSAYYQHNNNHFKYVNNNTSSFIQNALQRWGGVMWDGGILLYQKGETHTYISSHIWLQQNYRQIPPALFESASEKLTDEYNQKYLVQLHWLQSHRKVVFKSAYLIDNFKYEDGFIGLKNKYDIRQAIIGLNYQQRLNIHILERWSKQFEFDVPFNYQYFQGNASQFISRVAGVGSLFLKSPNQRFSSTLIFRQEFNQYQTVPFLPNIQLKYKIIDAANTVINLHASINKSYRLPTLNEWYYFPGGNTELRPEYGWSKELGVSVLGSYLEKLQIQLRTHYFDRTINDWIYWLGGAIWTPHNIAQVRSYGIDNQLAIQFDYSSKLRLHFNWNLTALKSVVQSSYIFNDGSVGKQIPYSPKLNQNFNIGVTYANWSLYINNQYVGYRFTTIDESQFIDDYLLMHLRVMKYISRNRNQFQIMLGIDNLLNTTYYEVYARPLPSRTFSLGVNIRI